MKVNTLLKLLMMLTILISSNTFAAYASWYGPGFHGRTTANGEKFNMHAMTAAHKSLPFGSKVEVTNLENNKTVVVRINDRGPFIKSRIIDLSKAANNILKCDLCKVKIKVLK